MKRLLFLVPAFLAAAALPLLAQTSRAEKSKSAAPRAAAPAAPASELTQTAPAAASSAAELSRSDPPAHMASIFFGLLQKGEIDPAYETLTKGSKIAERPEELKVLKSKTREAIEVFGSVTGFELVEGKLVGTRLLRRTYLSLGREFPLRWRFYFYRADNVWRLVDLRVDDRLTGMFDEIEEPRTPETKP